MGEGEKPAQFTRRQLRQFERQLADHGKESLLRSRERLEARLVEHLKELQEIRAVGGYTSSVEREMRNFEQQIDAIDEVLGRLP